MTIISKSNVYIRFLLTNFLFLFVLLLTPVSTFAVDCPEPYHDFDGDGVCSDTDVCPDNPLKSDPLDIDPTNPAIIPGSVSSLNPAGIHGRCSCFIDETDPFHLVDTDGDGRIDCADECVYDAFKTEYGQCGCGVSETDSDGDGFADCRDQCPLDNTKIVPLECGCGQPEEQDCGFELEEFVPFAPSVNYDRASRVLTVVMQPLEPHLFANFPGLFYEVRVERRRVRRNRRTGKRRVIVREVIYTSASDVLIHSPFPKRGRVRISYSIVAPDDEDPDDEVVSYESKQIRLRR